MSDGNGGEMGGAGSEGGAADFMASLKSEFGNVRQEMGNVRAEANEARNTINRIKEAVGGEKEAESYWYDEMLDQLLEAEKSGKSLPMTARLAAVLASNEKTTKTQEATIAELKKRIDQLQNPQTHINTQTYAQLDNLVSSNLEKVFGEVDQHIYNAVSVKIADTLKELQKSYPDQWKDIQRNDGARTKLVSWAIQSMVPPSAKKLVMDKYEESQPLTDADFQRAFDEAKQIPNAQLRARAITQIRQAHWEHKYNANRRPTRR